MPDPRCSSGWSPTSPGRCACGARSSTGCAGLFRGAVAAAMPLALAKEFAGDRGLRGRGAASWLAGGARRRALRASCSAAPGRGGPARRPRLRPPGSRLHRARVGRAPRPHAAGRRARRRRRARVAALERADHRAARRAARGQVRPGAAGPGRRAGRSPRRFRCRRAGCRTSRSPATRTRRSPRSAAGELETRTRSQADQARGRPQRSEMQDRTLAPRAGGGGPSQPGDLAAVFKDTALARRAPDFNSFLKKGDDRIRMLEQVDRLPDLQSDFTQNQTGGLPEGQGAAGRAQPDEQVSPEKLRELLHEMERLGRKGGRGRQSAWGGDVSEGMEALEGGQSDRAMEAMERALSKMRSMEDKGPRRQGPPRRPRERPARRPRAGRGRGRRAARATRATSPRARGCCPAAARARRRRATPPQRLRGNPLRRRRGGRVARRARRTGSTPTWSAVARTCRRACSTSACSGSTGR